MYASRKSWKIATIISLMQGTWKRFASFQEKDYSVKGMDINFDQPYSLPPGSGVFALALKSWWAVSVKRKCLRWSKRSYFSVVCAVSVCKTHD